MEFWSQHDTSKVPSNPQLTLEALSEKGLLSGMLFDLNKVTKRTSTVSIDYCTLGAMHLMQDSPWILCIYAICTRCTRV